MNRRAFLAAISAAYGVTVLPPRLYKNDLDFVAQAEDAVERLAPAETVTVPVVFIDADGREHLRKDVPFTVTHIRDLDGNEAVEFKAVGHPTWESVDAPLVIAKIAALIPFGATAHRVYFPIGVHVYANGGNITVDNLKAILT